MFVTCYKVELLSMNSNEKRTRVTFKQEKLTDQVISFDLIFDNQKFEVGKKYKMDFTKYEEINHSGNN